MQIMEINPFEPLIDDLWFYQSVVLSPKHRKPSFHTDPFLLNDVNPSLQDGSTLPLHDEVIHSRHPSTPKPSVLTLHSNPQEHRLDVDDLRPQNILDLQRVFDTIDSNHNGKVTGTEVCAWMKKLGVSNFSEDVMVHIIAKAGIDMNGSLNFDEFVSLNRAIDLGRLEDDSEVAMEDSIGESETKLKAGRFSDPSCVHGNEYPVSKVAAQSNHQDDVLAHTRADLYCENKGKVGKLESLYEQVFSAHRSRFVADAEEYDSKQKGDKDQENQDRPSVDHELLHTFMLRDVFELFDRDHNGFISPRELSIALENLGLHKGSWQDHKSMYVDMIKRVDLDGDGQVNFVEFQRMMDLRPIDFQLGQ